MLVWDLFGSVTHIDWRNHSLTGTILSVMECILLMLEPPTSFPIFPLCRFLELLKRGLVGSPFQKVCLSDAGGQFDVKSSEETNDTLHFLTTQYATFLKYILSNAPFCRVVHLLIL